MKSYHSLQREPPPTRSVPPYILVSYHRAIMGREEYALISRLIHGLQSIGVRVVADELQDMQIPPGVQLHAYDWILLVETQNAASSTFVEERLARALNQDSRPHQGILHVRVSTADYHKKLPGADSVTFDAGVDYARAFAGIVLTIYPDYRTRLYGIERGATALDNTTTNPFSGIFTNVASLPRSMTNKRQPLTVLSIILVILILLGAIVTHSFAFSSPKITTIHTIQTTNQHQNKPMVIAKATTPQALYKIMTSRTPVINDSLQGQSASQWDVMQQQGISCTFTNGAYHVSILPPAQGNTRQVCLAQRPIFTNFAMQVDMQLLKGDVGGMVFHTDGHNAYSWFALDSHGCYRLVYAPAGDLPRILAQDCPAIPMQKTNQLTVIAQDGNIYVYINGKFMHTMADQFIMKGGIGLLAIDRTQPTDVAFNNLKVWQ